MILNYSGLKKIGFLVNDLETAPIKIVVGKDSAKKKAKFCRTRIIKYLRKNGYSVPNDICSALKVKQTLVMHSLTSLIKSGELERTKLKAKLTVTSFAITIK